MTLEELELYVFALEANYDDKFTEIEKELAVLKGRVDGLEARLGEIEANQGSGFLPTLVTITTYDIKTKKITESVKSITTNNLPGASKNPQTSVSSNDFAMIASFDESIILDNNSNNGVYKTKSIKNYGDATFTGKDLVLGSSGLSRKHYLNFGLLPTSAGQRLIINKQKILK
jgi:hypothetical protein